MGPYVSLSMQLEHHPFVVMVSSPSRCLCLQAPPVPEPESEGNGHQWMSFDLFSSILVVGSDFLGSCRCALAAHQTVDSKTHSTIRASS